MINQEIKLQSGILQISYEPNDNPSLDSLLEFATRANPKRGFLFVSRVLGKHIPCKPSSMRRIYDLLAEEIQKLPIDEPLHTDSVQLVIGMAETATGLGAGVADSLARRCASTQVISQQTTRHAIDCERLLTFDEAHSHAPDQLLYLPQTQLADAYFNADRLILVDDEITSGRTLTELAKALTHRINNANERSKTQLKELVFVSIVSWLNEEQKLALEAQLPCALRTVSLFEGSFHFTPDPSFTPKLPGRVSAQESPRSAREDLGRRGMRIRASEDIESSFLFDVSALDRERGLTVIGTGEHAYHSFLLAEKLERLGFDVLYQSSTRSPILLGGAISTSLVINDEHDEGVTNYLHNPPIFERRVILSYESESCARGHGLRSALINEGHSAADVMIWVTPESDTQ